MDHFLYPKHFLLLTCFSLLLAVTSRPAPVAGDLSVSFALYGALHASALVLSLRARQPIARSGLFVAVAAALCLLTLRVGIVGRHLFGALPGTLALYTALGLAAVTGALTYGILIRLAGIFPMTLGGLGAISLGCLSAAFLALFTARLFRVSGPWWLAMLWWYAYSGGLWYFDQRHSRAVQGRDPRRQ
jgi:hypothetical protein